MTFQVRVLLHPHQELFHAGSIYTGLLRLERQGSARVRFVRDGSLETANPVTVTLEVDRGGARRRLAFDLFDSSERFDEHHLSDSDVYFKWSYFRPDVAPLGSTAERIRPFGLNFSCRGAGLVRRGVRALGPSRVRRLGSLAVRDLRALKRDLKQWSGILQIPALADLERGPESPTEPVVFFHRQLWKSSAHGSTAEEANLRRVALVRALRGELGDRFWGGIRATPFALRQYDEVYGEDVTADISNLPEKSRAFVARMRAARIGVYTAGLHESTSFILPEYLACSKVIVAEGFRNELPEPLVEGTHYRAFQEPDECAKVCAELLNDEEQVARMRRANHEYYRTQVEPAAHMRRCLEEAFA